MTANLAVTVAIPARASAGRVATPERAEVTAEIRARAPAEKAATQERAEVTAETRARAPVERPEDTGVVPGRAPVERAKEVLERAVATEAMEEAREEIMAAEREAGEERRVNEGAEAVSVGSCPCRHLYLFVRVNVVSLLYIFDLTPMPNKKHKINGD